jgi:acyl-CoA hydrolase
VDVQYVETDYGIAYHHGKNVRERAMELIVIAHPKFVPG